ncbi:MAG: hypothetical protein DSY81_09220 [Bacillota bacterium]|nr:MAG: hypothetical protein DSY92_04985 [Planctomycetota bacterium]RUA08431.1 MAG: hypothetical protein DSY81_09220 [Bacillota bacterium]
MNRLVGLLSPLVLVMFGFYIPIIWVAIEDGALSLEGIRALPGSGDAPVILATIRVAGLAALLATAIGWLDAVLLAGTRGRWRSIVVILLLASFLIPPAALASAVQACIGSSSLRVTVRDELGAVLMLALRWAPMAAAMLLGAATMWPLAQERSLRTLPPLAALLTRARAMLPGALRCAGLLLLLLIPAAELPSYAGVETVSQRILIRLTVGDPAAGWQLAFLLVVLASPAIFLLTRALEDPSRSRRGGGIEGLPKVIWADRILLVRVLPAVALIMILAITAWPRASELAVAGDELLSAALAIGQELPRALLASLVAVLCGWRLADGGHRIGLLLLCLPTLLPGSLGAIALVSTVRPMLPPFLDDLPFLLTVAQICKLGALAAAAGFVATRVLPAAERDAASLIPPTTARWRVRFPRALPVLVPAVVIGIALVMGEVESTLLLAPPGHPSTALELHQLLHFRNDEQAARLALMLALFGASMSALIVKPWRRGE